MQPLDVLLVALATWRLAYFVSSESGPFAFMQRLRAKNDLGGLLTCPKCVSIWAAGLMVFLVFTPLVFVVWVFAVSGAALMLASYSGANHQ